MDEPDELRGEIERLKKELALLKSQDTSLNQGMIKKTATVAGGMTNQGILEKEIKKIDLSKGFDTEEVKSTTFFSIKGHPLEKELVCRCSFCSIILTEEEKIEINNRVYCEKCYREEENDLDRDSYKILLCILSGFTSTSSVMEYLGHEVTIQRIAGLSEDEIEKRIEKLLEQGYLFLYGLFFKRIRVSSKGEEALAAYNQIYRDGDCNLVKDRIIDMGV